MRSSARSSAWKYAYYRMATAAGVQMSESRLLHENGRAHFIVVLVGFGGLRRSAILGGDESLLGPFIAIATILALDMVMAHKDARSCSAEQGS